MKTISTEDRRSRLMSSLTGIFLNLVGLSFLVLMIALKVRGELAGDVKISTFMFGLGGLLIGIGSKYFLSSTEQYPPTSKRWLTYLLRLRPLGEVIAALGCLLMLAHAAAVLDGRLWPPMILFWALVVSPVVLALYTLRVLIPDAFRGKAFSETRLANWSPRTRLFVRIFFRTSWFGYAAIVVVWFELDEALAMPWRAIAQAIASLLIASLYGSQVVLLHFGRFRE